MKYLAFLLLLIPAAANADSKIVRFSMGGDIEVDDARQGASLRTMGGDIRIDRAGGKVTAKTMGGNIYVDRLEGSLDAGTMGGNVEVEVFGAGAGRNIEITSMGGSIELTLPKDLAADFEVVLEQDANDPPNKIISDFPLNMRQSTKRRWFRKVNVVTASGRNGSGGTRVRLWTAGADITIRKR
ncbi:MAG TPA: hypothetical protein VKB93_26365 [Thermoanaerobaculia bacterium]|nr:hypothetical protein [Thermoanaerobaculia bacterium]